MRQLKKQCFCSMLTGHWSSQVQGLDEATLAPLEQSLASLQPRRLSSDQHNRELFDIRSNYSRLQGIGGKSWKNEWSAARVSIETLRVTRAMKLCT